MWSLWILCSLQKWAPRTSKCLFFRLFYSRAPQVRCQVAGAQSCSWYFIGILQLRETVALEMMVQLPPLGRPGFILLNCSPKNTALDSQVRCTFLCAALLAQNGHKPSWTCCLGWCGQGERVGGLVFWDHPVRLLVKRALKFWRVRRTFVSVQTCKGNRCLCARIKCLVWPAVTLNNLFGVNSEKIWVNIVILGSWKDVDNL